MVWVNGLLYISEYFSRVPRSEYYPVQIMVPNLQCLTPLQSPFNTSSSLRMLNIVYCILLDSRLIFFISYDLHQTIAWISLSGSMSEEWKEGKTNGESSH